MSTRITPDSWLERQQRVRQWVATLPLNSSQKAVMFCLAGHCDVHFKCCPAQYTIAAQTSLSLATVERACAALKAAGIIAWRMRYKTTPPGVAFEKKRDSNLYRIRFPATAKDVEKQLRQLNKFKSASKPVQKPFSRGATHHHEGGKGNLYINNDVIQEHTPPASLRDFSRPEGFGLDVMLDFFRTNGLLEIEVAAHDASKDRVVRRKNYWLSAERKKIGAWLKAAEMQGLGGFIKPVSEPKHRFIFIDDLDSAGIAQASKLGMPGLAVETSAGNYQIWLAGKKEMSDKERHSVQQQLIAQLGGDPGASSGKQFGRAAGSINTKPGRNSFQTHCFTLSDVGLHVTIIPTSSVQLIKQKPVSAVKKPHVVSLRTGDDQSAVEFGWTIKAIKSGVSEVQIVDELAARRLQRKQKKGKADALRYAGTTLRAARLKLGLPGP